MKLNNQEIRNCIYGGAFNNLLKELDKLPSWRRLNKMQGQQSYRFTKQEIMLRFFAFMDERRHYEGHLAKFLNAYMHSHQNDAENWISGKRQLFIDTAEIASKVVKNALGGDAHPKLKVTILEALLVGIGVNLPKIKDVTEIQLVNSFRELLFHPEFSDGALREGLSKKRRVTERLKTAIRIFAA
ncbi:MAG: hypothetical protein EXR08_03005 [Alphaproteobacteria bacterium]|nr:hypothetical protein [Alphaproteobacteria bacterium]